MRLPRWGAAGSYRPGDEPVGLAELVSPLRYDVLVRARFLELLAERLTPEARQRIERIQRDELQRLGHAI
jgi:hypothetical protein